MKARRKRRWRMAAIGAMLIFGMMTQSAAGDVLVGPWKVIDHSGKASPAPLPETETQPLFTEPFSTEPASSQQENLQGLKPETVQEVQTSAKDEAAEKSSESSTEPGLTAGSAVGSSAETASEKTAASEGTSAEESTEKEPAPEPGSEKKDTAETEAVSEPGSEKEDTAETEAASETEIPGEAAAETEAASETLEPAADDPDGDGTPEGEDPAGGENSEGDDPSGEDSKSGEKPAAEKTLAVVSISEDINGAYIYHDFTKKSRPSVLTFTLVDSQGNTVGVPQSVSTAGDSEGKQYLFTMTDSAFGLTQADMGKTIRLKITVESEAGNEEGISETSVTLRNPSMTMPQVISYTAAPVAADLLDINKISGLSFDYGSLPSERYVEKQEGDGWTTLEESRALTASDTGTYRIRIHTLFGDTYSNTFRLTIPAVGVETKGEEQIGSAITAVPLAENGLTPSYVSYEWFYGEDGSTIVSTDATYTPTLQEVLAVQTVTLSVRIRDEIGNRFTKVLTLAPMDLSKQMLTAQYDDEEILYTGESRMPRNIRIFMGEYQLPNSLYTVSPADGKNTVDAGDAWMRVTGDGTYLTGDNDIRFTIDTAEIDIEEDDFILSFAYDGKRHKPLLDEEVDGAGKLKYSNWQRENDDGSWSDISHAPKKPGNFRVDITVKPVNANYDPEELEQVEFEITGSLDTEKQKKEEPEPAPEKENASPAPAGGQQSQKSTDSSKTAKSAKSVAAVVTDEKGTAAPYQTEIVVSENQESDTAQLVYRISADPVKEADGTVRRDENGKPVYEPRLLHVTQEVLREMEERGCTWLRFTLGDGAVQIQRSALTGGSSYVLRLAVLKETDLTDGEINALSGRMPEKGLYDLKIRTEEGKNVTEEFTSRGVVQVLVHLDSPEEVQEKSILYLKEIRSYNQQDPEPVLFEAMPVQEEDQIFLMAPAPGEGVFGLVRTQG